MGRRARDAGETAASRRQYVGDLAALGERRLSPRFGKANGRHLFELSQAFDVRPVEPDRATKSIGHERRSPRDLHDQGELRTSSCDSATVSLARCVRRVSGRPTMTLKVRFAGFTTITRSTTLPAPVATAAAVVDAVRPLLASIDPTPGCVCSESTLRISANRLSN